jgi:hypothetical protein
MSKRKREIEELINSPEPKKETLKSADVSINIGILLKGDITRKVFEIWQSQTLKKLNHLNLTLSTSISEKNDVIIVAAKTNLPTLRAWLSKYERIISSKCVILSSTWMISLMKTAELPSYDSHILNPWNGQSNLKNTTNITVNKMTIAPLPQTPSHSSTTLPLPDSTSSTSTVLDFPSELEPQVLSSTISNCTHLQPSNSNKLLTTTTTTQTTNTNQNSAPTTSIITRYTKQRSTTNSSHISSTAVNSNTTTSVTTAPPPPPPSHLIPRMPAGLLTKGFACQKTGNLPMKNANQFLTDILEDLQTIYELTHDEWRARGYKTVISTLKQLPRITSIQQLKHYRGFGDSILEKIQEILTTGQLNKLHYFQQDSKIQSLMELSKIWGVGEKTALQLMKQGFTNIGSLRTEKGLKVLTRQQQIGLKYYEEFLQKIPRLEMELLFAIVQEQAMM